MAISKITAETISTISSIYATGRIGLDIPGVTTLASPVSYSAGELMELNSSTGLYEKCDDLSDLVGFLRADVDATEETKYGVIANYADLNVANISTSLATPTLIGVPLNYGIRIMEVD